MKTEIPTTYMTTRDDYYRARSLNGAALLSFLTHRRDVLDFIDHKADRASREDRSVWVDFIGWYVSNAAMISEANLRNEW